MATRRRALGHRDASEKQAVASLRKMGFHVSLLDDPLDALVARGGVAFLVEFKSPLASARSPKGGAPPWFRYPENEKRLRLLNPKQREFVAVYPGPWCLAMCAEDVTAFYAWLPSHYRDLRRYHG